MSLRGAGEAEAFHRQAIEGQRQVIAWGLGGQLPYIASQSPYPFHGIIDRDPAFHGRGFGGMPIHGPDILLGLDPERTLVMVTAAPAFASEIARAVAEYGKFPVVMPPDQNRLVTLNGHRRIGTPVPWPDGWPVPVTGTEWLDPAAHLATSLQRAARPSRQPSKPPGHACLSIARIATGGAERQMVYLASGLRQLGWRVSLVCALPPTSAAAAYIEMLDRHGVERHVLPTERGLWDGWDEAQLARYRPLLDMGRCLRPSVLHHLLALTAHVDAARPDLLISSTDDTNVITGMAGVLTGVPQTLMSLRSLNPSNQTKLQPTCGTFALSAAVYHRLLEHPSVRISANSHAGALSYARWIGCPPDAITVVPNIVDPAILRIDREAARTCTREILGVPAAAPLLVGVMRFTEEKKPVLFVEVAADLCREIPDLRVLLVGDGPMRPEVEAARDALGVAGRVILTGQRSDVFNLIAAGDLLLQTSRLEGMPNVVMEAQALGLPVVATAVGGTLDALAPALHPFTAPEPDRAALAARCRALLNDPQNARRLGAEAAGYVRGRTDLVELARHTLEAAGIREETSPSSMSMALA